MVGKEKAEPFQRIPERLRAGKNAVKQTKKQPLPPKEKKKKKKDNHLADSGLSLKTPGALVSLSPSSGEDWRFASRKVEKETAGWGEGSVGKMLAGLDH